VSFHSATVLLGWAAVLVGFFGVYAQFHRAGTIGVEGVSLGTWILFVYMGCFWITYGLFAHSPEVSLGSVVAMPLQLAILFRLKPWKHPRVAGRALVFFSLCCLLPGVMWGWAGALFGIGVAMTINRGPQLIELIRHEDASGVSVGSWALGVLGCSLWITYYVGAHLWAALTATAFAGLANLSIAVMASSRHRQMRQRRIAQEVFAG
jgi:uncharacterized protein with PQ loop repeat